VLLYSDKVKTCRERNVRRPSFCLGNAKCGKVMIGNEDKVNDKLVNHKERRIDCYTDKIIVKVVSLGMRFTTCLIPMENCRQV